MVRTDNENLTCTYYPKKKIDLYRRSLFLTRKLLITNIFRAFAVLHKINIYFI